MWWWLSQLDLSSCPHEFDPGSRIAGFLLAWDWSKRYMTGEDDLYGNGMTALISFETTLCAPLFATALIT